MKLKVKKLTESAKLPFHAHKGDAGIDLFSDEETVIYPGETKAVSTGISLEIPEGYVGLIWDRSSMAFRYSIHTLSGVIDSGYRGEIKVIINNLGKEEFRIEKGMKFAQMLIQPVLAVEIEEVELLTETSRQEGGFGSTGMYHQSN